MNYIRLYTGEKFYFDDLDANTYNIADIAHALTYTNRFNGHRGINPVSTHCIRVADRVFSRVARMQGVTEESCHNAYLGALLHDAAEAYVGDMVSPLKHMEDMKPFMHLDVRITVRIYEQFGVTMTKGLFQVIAEEDAKDLHDELDGRIVVEGHTLNLPKEEKRYIKQVVRALTNLHEIRKE